jgi:vacuolar-type H+-ATPase subunit F/Vma7
MSTPEAVKLDTPLAIIGDEDIILGFNALGFKPYPAKDKEAIDTALGEVVAKKTAVCLVQDDIYKIAESKIASYKNLPLPVFVPFAKKEKSVLFDDIIKNIRLKATGAF